MMMKSSRSKLALVIALGIAGAGPAYAADADHMMMGGSGKMDHSQMLRQMDTDKNGTVSEAEFLDHARSHFKEMDKNGDGQLTAEEMHAGMGTHCEGMMGDHAHGQSQSGGMGGMGMGGMGMGGMGMGGMGGTHSTQ